MIKYRAKRITGGDVSWELDDRYEIEITYNQGHIFRVWDKGADRTKDKPVIYYFTNGKNGDEKGVHHQSPIA